MKLNSKLNSLRQQAGYTLIELSISIAVISVLVVSALYGVQKILDSNKVNQAVKQVSVANVNITKLVAMTNNKAVAQDTAQTINLGAWPDEITTPASGASSTAIAKNPFGGDYKVLAAASPNNLTHYVIGIENVPAKLCAATASGMGAIAEHITVETTAQTAAPSHGTAASLGSTVKLSGVFDASNLASKCGTSGNKFIYLFMPFGA